MDEETINHLFLGCLFSIRNWDRLAQCLRMHLPQLPPIVNLLWSSSDTYLSTNATRYYRIYQRRLLSGGFEVNEIIESLMTWPNHPTKHSVFTLLLFLSGSISFQADPRRWWGGLWSIHKWMRSSTATPKRRMVGKTTTTQTICDQWHFGALILSQFCYRFNLYFVLGRVRYSFASRFPVRMYFCIFFPLAPVCTETQ